MWIKKLESCPYYRVFALEMNCAAIWNTCWEIRFIWLHHLWCQIEICVQTKVLHHFKTNPFHECSQGYFPSESYLGYYSHKEWLMLGQVHKFLRYDRKYRENDIQIQIGLNRQFTLILWFVRFLVPTPTHRLIQSTCQFNKIYYYNIIKKL